MNNETVVQISKPFNADEYSLSNFITVQSTDLLKKTVVFSQFLGDAAQKGYGHPYLQDSVAASTGRIRLAQQAQEREVIQMNTANYLGLASHPRVKQAAHRAIEQYGTSSGGVPLIAGTTNVHKTLERTLAQFKGIEEVVLFQTGYAANTGAIAALVGAGDWIVFDKQVHASILDGVALSRAKFASFRHSDPEHLRQRLETIRRTHKKGGILVILEGVYGIDGDIPPLPAMLEIIHRYDARLLIDECHATGILGATGRGLAEHFGLSKSADLVMDSLSKALGSLGGWIGASKEVTDYLRYYAKPITFSVGLPAINAASALAALQVLYTEPGLVAQLQENAQIMRTGLLSLGIKSVERSVSAIMSIEINDEVTLRKLTTELFQEGLWVEGIPYPAVPRGQERLRLRVNARHTRTDLADALALLAKKLHHYGIIG
ncbi:MAG: aminotransferase class I/II-fold pyridoxal phosphate-dependent enzyme [Caldilineaceae bacterium]